MYFMHQVVDDEEVVEVVVDSSSDSKCCCCCEVVRTVVKSKIILNAKCILYVGSCNRITLSLQSVYDYQYLGLLLTIHRS